MSGASGAACWTNFVLRAIAVYSGFDLRESAFICGPSFRSLPQINADERR
jgi:hypothetical protein